MPQSNTQEAIDKLSAESNAAVAAEVEVEGKQLSLADVLSISQDYINRAYEQYDVWKTQEPWKEEPYVNTVLWARPDSAWQLLHVLPEEEPFGYIVKSHSAVETFDIVLRGTRNASEWWTDGEVEQTDSPIGLVHKGFYDIAAQLADDIGKFFITFPITERPVLQIHGHSLGGGVGYILSSLLALQGWRVVAILWAAPRALSVEAAKVHARLVPDTLRLVNSEDIVPTGPLPVMGKVVYSHVGTVVLFTLNTGTLSGNHSMNTYGIGVGTDQGRQVIKEAKDGTS